MEPRARKAVSLLFPVVVVGVVVAVASAGIWLQGRDLAARLRWKRLFPVDPSRVTSLRIAARGEDVFIERDGRGWRIRSPVDAEADPAIVRAVLLRFASLERRATVAPAGEPPERLRSYGLDAPTARIEVTLEGGRVERLALGSDTGADGVMFAMPTGGDVVVVPADARAALERPLADLRRGGGPARADGPAPGR